MTNREWPEMPEDYHSEIASCGHEIWGTNADIDSGMRKHLEYCEDAPDGEND